MFAKTISTTAFQKTINRQFIRTMVNAKAIVYSNYGIPSEEIKVHKYTIDSPTADGVVLKTLAHPINPSDINQIEGVYPSRPQLAEILGSEIPIAVAGNEALSKVVEVGPDVKDLKVGDWVIPSFPNYGTWRSHCSGKESDYIKIGSPEGNLTKNAAACLSVNTCTAYEMLTTITKLEPGDWFVQNGGTSSVGRFAVQIAKILGYNSISVVRDRPNIEEVKQELQALGATHVITEEQCGSRQFLKTIKQWIGNGQVKLALNCVGGESSSNLARKLSPDGFFVTYGGMSKRPVTFPTSLFIFKNLTAKGYWITKNNFKDLDQKKHVVKTVLEYFRDQKLVAATAEETEIDWEALGDAEVLKFYQDSLQRSKSRKQLIVSKD
ncbi:enoyl-[acyl-carrier-protein] reductase [Saccharomycopsis crataegensis]|uniref:enoyl-[acyl-carrier-protein] reductase n=1 Tax=Saccharomycopsis crataegensis TaxID=43959 RepID=A0AAV5QKI7_9ASCO|nr:enoyl-[acyl-carrier-protein] reductase [Saccharomycopsis crataegensis]